jgi:hypothetical protein
MRSVMVVIRPPRFDLAPGIRDRQKLIRVQTFIAQLAVKGFDKAVFDRLSWSDEVEQNTPLVRPFIEHSRSELGAMIDSDGPWFAVLGDRAIECFCDRAS